MKRICAALMAAVLAFACLSGCGTSRNVPDKVIEWEIEDYLDRNASRYGEVSEYCYKIRHDPDRKTNTDSVTVDVNVIFPDMTAETTFRCVYQRDQSRDSWTALRGYQWDEFSFSVPVEAWKKINGDW